MELGHGSAAGRLNPGHGAEGRFCELPIAEVRIGNRFRRDMGDTDALAASMARVGLLQPIVITPDQMLVAGRRRLEAARKLGWGSIAAVTVSTLGDALRRLQAERDENTERKGFAPSEAVALAEALEPLEREAARGRQGTRNDLQLGADSAPSQNGCKSRDKIAAAVGLGRDKLTKAREVVAAAEAEPERFAPLVEEMDRTGRVHGVFKKLNVARQSEALEREPTPLPQGPFRVLVADPPWSYDARAADASHRSSNPYPSLSVEQICALSIGKLAEADSVLWLWTTNAHLPVAFAVAEAWGFTYKTTLTWVKDRMGMGDWLRGQTEHCLLCVKGRPTVRLSNQTTVINGPLREHSRKPEEFYSLVEALCPGSKVELFSRTAREGWASYGDQPGLFPAE